MKKLFVFMLLTIFSSQLSAAVVCSTVWEDQGQLYIDNNMGADVRLVIAENASEELKELLESDRKAACFKGKYVDSEDEIYFLAHGIK